MPFDYYERLSQRGQAIYRESASVAGIKLPHCDRLRPIVDAVRLGLEQDDRSEVERACQLLTGTMLRMLKTSPVHVRVLAVRPHSSRSELHGLYTREAHKRPVIEVWMRTAAQHRVVAFRTFLRTLLHEIGHHLDYELLKLPDSLHTEGFFRRESSLMRQLAPRVPAVTSPALNGVEDAFQQEAPARGLAITLPVRRPPSAEALRALALAVPAVTQWVAAQGSPKSATERRSRATQLDLFSK